MTYVTEWAIKYATKQLLDRVDEIKKDERREKRKLELEAAWKAAPPEKKEAAFDEYQAFLNSRA